MVFVVARLVRLQSVAFATWIVITVGCKDLPRTGLELRIKNEIAGWEEFPPLKGTEAGQFLQHKVIGLLKNADAETLRHPEIALVLVIRRDDGYRLIVYWLEATPTVDSFSLSYRDAVHVVGISQHDLDVTERWAKEGTLCHYLIDEFPSDSAVGALLTNATHNNELLLSIRHGGTPLSSTTSIHWMDERSTEDQPTPHVR
jgi:hypothetical protein